MKKTLSILLSFVMLFSITAGIDLSAYAATAHTQQEAVNWANAQIGKSVEFNDSSNPNQCVDLVQAYYNYLGASPKFGSAYLYKNSDYIPSGWSRVYSNYKPGDVAVWNNNHVGIIVSADSAGFDCVNQRYDQHPYVEKIRFNYSVLHSAIRPNFGSASSGTMTTPNIHINQNVYYLGDKMNISWDKTSANTDFYQYWLIIKNTTSGKQYYAGSPGAAGNVNANSYNFTVTETGNYLITVYAVPYNNKNSRQKVATKSFTANKNEVTFPTISLNKTTYSVGDTMHISWTATSSNTDFYQYWLIIKNTTNGKQYYGGATAGAGITTVNYYDFKIPVAGNYKITVYAVPYYNKGTRQKYDVKEISIHTYNNGVITKKATCTANGVKTYICTTCGASKKSTIKATGHSYKTTVTKATTKKNGSSVTKCTKCGNVSKKSTIYYPKTITLSTTSYTYDGKVKKPGVTVKDSAGKTISASNYTVTYPSGRKNVGTYKVTIKFKGNYSGTVSKNFTIKPRATTLSSVTAGKKKFTVKWKKQATQTTGYQIQYSTDKNFKKNNKTVTVSKNSTTSKSVSKLTAKKKYYVRIRTYKTVKVNGKNTQIYSSWSKSKLVTTK